MRVSRNIFFLFMIVSPLAEADIYRCTGEFGEPVYRQQPCGDDTAVIVPIRPASAGPVQGIRPSEQAWLEQRERASRRARKTKRPRRVSPAAEERAARKQAYRCRKKRRALDTVRAKLRRGYKPASGEKLRRRREAYEDYLETYCS